MSCPCWELNLRLSNPQPIDCNHSGRPNSLICFVGVFSILLLHFLHRYFVMIKMKINGRFLFCREEWRAWWRGFVYNARKGTFWDSVHRELQFVQEGHFFSGKLVPCSFSSSTCPYTFSHLNRSVFTSAQHLFLLITIGLHVSTVIQSSSGPSQRL